MSDFYEIRNAQSLKYFQYPSTKVKSLCDAVNGTSKIWTKTLNLTQVQYQKHYLVNTWYYYNWKRTTMIVAVY